MKKLLLLFVLLFTVSASFAQDGTKIITYEYANITKDGVVQGWIEVHSEFILYQNTMRVNIGNTTCNFTQLTNAETGKTEGGYGYKACSLRNETTGEEVVLQVFDDRKYGSRISFSRGNSIQFSN